MDRKNMTLPRHWLRQVREYRGLTRQQVIERMADQNPPCKMAFASYGRLETGRRSISELPLSLQAGLQQALEIPVEVWAQVLRERER